MSHRPEVAGALEALRAALQSSGTAVPAARRTVRLRIAFQNQCRQFMSLTRSSTLSTRITEGRFLAREPCRSRPYLLLAERPATAFNADLFATITSRSMTARCTTAISVMHFNRGRDRRCTSVCSCVYARRHRAAATMWIVTDDLPEAFLSSRIRAWLRGSEVRVASALAAARVGTGLRRIVAHPPVLAFGHDRLAGMCLPRCSA